MSCRLRSARVCEMCYAFSKFLRSHNNQPFFWKIGLVLVCEQASYVGCARTAPHGQPVPVQTLVFFFKQAVPGRGRAKTSQRAKRAAGKLPLSSSPVSVGGYSPPPRFASPVFFRPRYPYKRACSQAILVLHGPRLRCSP